MQRRPAPQQRLYPDGQFRHCDRLDDIVVGSGLEIFHLAVEVAAGSEDQRRHGVSQIPQLLEQRGAGTVAQLQVDDQQVIVIGLRIFEAVGRGVDANPLCPTH